jgi:hypothetical protein
MQSPVHIAGSSESDGSSSGTCSRSSSDSESSSSSSSESTSSSDSPESQSESEVLSKPPAINEVLNGKRSLTDFLKKHHLPSFKLDANDCVNVGHYRFTRSINHTYTVTSVTHEAYADGRPFKVARVGGDAVRPVVLINDDDDAAPRQPDTAAAAAASPTLPLSWVTDWPRRALNTLTTLVTTEDIRLENFNHIVVMCHGSCSGLAALDAIYMNAARFHAVVCKSPIMSIPLRRFCLQADVVA